MRLRERALRLGTGAMLMDALVGALAFNVITSAALTWLGARYLQVSAAGDAAPIPTDLAMLLGAGVVIFPMTLLLSVLAFVDAVKLPKSLLLTGWRGRE